MSLEEPGSLPGAGIPHRLGLRDAEVNPGPSAPDAAPVEQRPDRPCSGRTQGAAHCVLSALRPAWPPAYQNLRQKVDNFVSTHLDKQEWNPAMNKNQLRNGLRQSVIQSGMLEAGVDRIISQVVDPKLNHIFRPQIERAIHEFLAAQKKEESVPAPPPPEPENKDPPAPSQDAS
nr:PREDICTED: biorientation of chromosomes in cell division protein 1 [Opisthocomus hoazin]